MNVVKNKKTNKGFHLEGKWIPYIILALTVFLFIRIVGFEFLSIDD